jgi:hypothetical protein
MAAAFARCAPHDTPTGIEAIVDRHERARMGLTRFLTTVGVSRCSALSAAPSTTNPFLIVLNVGQRSSFRADLIGIRLLRATGGLCRLG